MQNKPTRTASLANSTLGSLKEINFINRALRGSLASLGVFMLGFCLAPTLASSVHAAEDVRSAVSWSPVSLTLDPGSGDVSGDVVFNFVAPTSVEGNNKGTMQVIKKNVSVTTTGQYYTVYLSTGSSSSNNLDYDGDSNVSIDAVNGSWSSPTSFSGNDWGYAVPGSPITSGFSSASTYANFDSILGTDLTYASSEYYNTGLWAAVPNSSTGAQQIWKATTTNANGFGGEHGDTNNNFNVYYAAVANTRLIAGEYTNTLVYTALASGGSLDNVSNNVARSERFITGGDVETLTFDLAMSVPTLTKNQVHVYLVPHRVTEANKDANGNYTMSVTNSIGVTGTTLADNYANSTYECVIGNNAEDFVLTANGTTSQAKLNCTIPTNPDRGTGGGSQMGGEYDFWISIDTYNYNYISQYKTTADSEVPSAQYAGLQTLNRAGTDFLITNMQDMTGSICKNTLRWGTGTGSAATLLSWDGIDIGVSGDDMRYRPTPLSDWPGTFALTDARDGKPYLVRRLADGNCWMVQNLDLDLSTVGTLTASDTDLNSKTFWTPDATTIASSFVDAGTSARWRDNAYSYIDSENNLITTDTSFNASHATGYLGDYYNWYGAVAESSNTTSQLSNSEVEDSICPRGWKLPGNSSVVTTKTWYSLLNDVYGSPSISSILQLPISLVLSGSIYPLSNVQQVVRSWGNFWSSDATDLGFNNYDSYYWRNPDSPSYGFAVRCVARD